MDPSSSSTHSTSSGEAASAPAHPVPGTLSLPFPPSQPTQPHPHLDYSQHAPQEQHHHHQLPSPPPVSPALPPTNASSLPNPPPYLAGTASSSNPLLPSLFIKHASSAAPSPAPSQSSSAPPAPTVNTSSGATRPRPPPIISYDPNAASDDDDEDEEGGSPKKKRKAAGGRGAAAKAATTSEEPEKGRRKIEIEYIQKKEKRHITFSKRKAGIMKKAYELATLTGTEVLLLVVSETGIVYTFTTTKFQPLVGAGENGLPSDGQRLIQQCLAVGGDDEHSDYISPPPDGPLLPLPPSAQKRPFEANSAIHGGQIALRTKQHRPRTKTRPAPIIPPAPGPIGSASLPTPSIHAQMDQMNMPMSPHQLHPLNPAPPQGSYPPSPGFPPPPPGMQRPSDLPSPMQTSHEYQEMMDRSAMNGQYPASAYPPPPALGYTHQLPNPPPPNSRPPHPLDPYPPHHHHSPNSSPRQARHLPPPPRPPHHASYQPAAPRTLGGDPYVSEQQHQHRATYGDDTRMLSPYPPHAQIPGGGGGGGGGNAQLPNPPAELYMQHGQLPIAPQGQQGGGMQPSPRQQHAQPMRYDGGAGGGYMGRG
ncbi:hypothetical protein JCM11641_005620 [Rhodosporidiobolus odoratus]